MTERSRLADLEMRGDFIRRHIGPDRGQIATMVAAVGLDSLEQIVEAAVPDDIVSNEPLALTETISERAVITYLRNMGARTRVLISMIGMGYYGTIMPEGIKRNVLENPAGIPPTRLTRPRSVRAASRPC